MGKKAAGGKRKKKSKEELEAERAAAEEAAREEAEATAAHEAEEAAARTERERQAAEERARLRAEELGRLGDEAAATRALADRRARAQDAFLRTRARLDEWTRFTRCDPLPAPASRADLNTYLSMVVDDPATGLEACLTQCDELAAVLNAALVAAVREHRLEAWRERVASIFDAQVRRLDRASARILTHADDFVTPKQEVLVTAQSPNVKIGLWANLATKGFRMKIIDYPDISVITEIPKAIALQNVAVRVVYTAADPITVPRCCTLGDYDQALGGALFVEAIKMPPLRKKVRGWSMMPVSPAVDGQVERLDFNADSGNDPVGSNTVSVSIKFKIPDNVIVRDVEGAHCKLEIREEELSEDKMGSTLAQTDGFKGQATLRIGAWDNDLRQWSEEGISDVAFDPHLRVVSLVSQRLTALAVLQRRCAEVPFLGWSITPIHAEAKPAPEGQPSTVEDTSIDAERAFVLDGSANQEASAAPNVNGALLHLRTLHWLIKIAVYDDGKCRLFEPILPELRHILGVLLEPAELLYKLAASGINISCPFSEQGGADEAEDDANAMPPPSLFEGTVQAKRRNLESHAYREISAAVSASFFVVSSTWNNSLGSDKCSVSLYEGKVATDESAGFDVAAFLREQLEEPENVQDGEAAAAQGDTGDQTNSDGQPPVENAESEAQPDGGDAHPAEGTGEEAKGEEQGVDGEVNANANGEEEEAKSGDEPGEEAKTEGPPADEGAEEQPKSTARSAASGASNKKKGKKGKKGKDKGPAQPEVEEEKDAENQEAEEEVVMEEDPKPDQPRTVLFEVDPEVVDTGIKCAFIRAKDADDQFDSTISKEQCTHVYLENALLAAGIYNEASVHRMQDDIEAVSLRHTIATVLDLLRPLSLTRQS